MTLTAPEILMLERDSIESFVRSCSGQIGGRVLDYGCGKQPYRQIVADAGGDYVGYDRADYPCSVGADAGPDDPLGEGWDTILCTQAIQYAPEPLHLIRAFQNALLDTSGYLILTGPTNWRELEYAELWRFTVAGIRMLLEKAGFEVVRCERRAWISPAPGFDMSLGYGVLARG